MSSSLSWFCLSCSALRLSCSKMSGLKVFEVSEMLSGIQVERIIPAILGGKGANVLLSRASVVERDGMSSLSASLLRNWLIIFLNMWGMGLRLRSVMESSVNRVTSYVLCWDKGTQVVTSVLLQLIWIRCIGSVFCGWAAISFMESSCMGTASVTNKAACAGSW